MDSWQRQSVANQGEVLEKSLQFASLGFVSFSNIIWSLGSDWNMCFRIIQNAWMSALLLLNREWTTERPVDINKGFNGSSVTSDAGKLNHTQLKTTSHASMSEKYRLLCSCCVHRGLRYFARHHKNAFFSLQKRVKMCSSWLSICGNPGLHHPFYWISA
jgi:hypothetical protein